MNSEIMDARPITDEYKYWTSSKFADPLAVDNGIKLTKPLSEVLNHWWSLRWLALLDQYNLGVRFERAKFYASRGQVLSIQIENGVVRSLVQGTDAEPYRVTIGVRTIPQAIWTAILSDFARSSHFGIKLASRSLPAEEEMDSAFRRNGALLFPDRPGEMQTKCTCLDWSNPCKHVAAVYVLLAVEFEKDPFLIFKLRGLGAQELFKLLKVASDEVAMPPQFVNASAEMVDVGKNSGEQFVSVEMLPASTECTASENVARAAAALQPARFAARTFWKKSINGAQILDTWSPPAEIAGLPGSLGEFPFWQGNREFLESVRPAYEGALQAITSLLTKVKELDSTTAMTGECD